MTLDNDARAKAARARKFNGWEGEEKARSRLPERPPVSTEELRRRIYEAGRRGKREGMRATVEGDDVGFDD